MGNRSEEQAGQLLDDFLTMLHRHQNPDASAFIARCPENERASLESALIAATVVYINANPVESVSEKTVQKTLKRISELKTIRERIRSAYDVMVQTPPRLTSDPLMAMTAALQIPAHIVENALTQSRQVMAQTSTTWHRGSTTSGNRKTPDSMRRRFDATYAEQAEILITRAGIESLPVDLAVVSRYLNVLVEDSPLEEGLDGCLITDGQIGGILISTLVQNAKRRRFTWAHELGHYVLHKHVRLWKDHARDVGSPFAQEAEADANAFASGLLMPRSLLQNDISSKEPSFAIVDMITKACDVSFVAAALRLVKVSDWPCALVSVRSGKVEWYMGSDEFEWFIQPERTVHPSSTAAVVTDVSHASKDGLVLPARMWVGDAADEEAEIYEQSRRIGDRVYSLLHLVSAVL